MLLGRVLGWILLALAALMASGEAVLALGGAGLEGLSTREIWTLLAGRTPSGTTAGVVLSLLDWPAWVVIGGLGFGFTVLFRPRPVQRRARRRRSPYL
ncbi:hypothetical protein [Pararhodospirillum photometricum]|nr:hypothetical protein [Pararhodospirillum photometricum]